MLMSRLSKFYSKFLGSDTILRYYRTGRHCIQLTLVCDDISYLYLLYGNETIKDISENPAYYANLISSFYCLSVKF